MIRPRFALLGRRLRTDERGFSLVEIVVAMGIILISLTMLATTALVGFSGAATARHRQAATASADATIEAARSLSWSTLTLGMRDSDLTGDPNIASCSGTYKYGSCSGETIVHSSGAATPPLYPHQVTDASGYTRSAYLTLVAGNTSLYRLTVIVTWTYRGSTSSIQTQTLLSHPAGTGNSSTQGSAGASVASFYGTGTVTPGTVVVSPNATVYSGIGVTGLTSSVWNLGDSLTQTMYNLDADLAQGQTTTVNGQATTTSVKKSISGAITSSGGTTTLSQADDDPLTTVGTSSAPSAISQTGPSLSLSGSGNSLTMNQYTQTTTTTTTTGNVTKRSASSATSANGTVTVTAPAGMTAGDLLLAGLSYQGTCMAAPSGWTLIRCDTNGNSATSSVFYRFATASDVTAGSFTFSSGGWSGTVAGVIAYTGADPSAPIDTSGGATGTSTTATTPTMSVTSNARLVSFFSAFGNTTITPVDPGTAANNWGQNWSATGGSSQKYYLTSTPALSTTAGSGTLSSGSTTSSSFVTAKTFAITVNTSIPNGTHTWPLTVSVASASLSTEYEYRFYLARQNSGGTTQSTSGYSTTFTGTGTKSYSFSWDPGTWATGDKLVVVWEHRKIGGSGTKSGSINTTSASYLDPTGGDFWVGGAAAGGDKRPAGQGVLASGWTATLSQSAAWVAQLVSLKPNNVTTTTTTTGAPGTESGSTVSTTAAAASPACGSPAQTDGRPCAYATQSYAVPGGVDNAFLSTKVDFTGSTNGYSSLGTCLLYSFVPPSTSPTNYAYGRKAATSGDGKITEDVSRAYGTHTFGQMCSGTGSTPSSWPGYFVKFDAGTSASRVTADAGVSAASPTTTNAGTISVWNGSGVTSFSVPTSGTWSTTPTAVDFTTSSNYRYQISATLGSGVTYTKTTGASPITEAQAVVGSPVIGTISYKLTDQSTSRVLIDVTISVDLGSLIAYGKYTAAA